MMKESIDTKTPPGYEEVTAPPTQGASDTKVRLNVGGQKFTTWSSTLAKLPGTRLSGLTQEDPAYDREENEYFFDRNPWLFPYILNAYRDEVYFPESVCVPAMQAELLYWGLGEQLVPAYCWKTFSTWAEDQETAAIVDASLKPSSPTESGGWRGKMSFVWKFLDDARSSKFATVWLLFYTLLLVLSLAVLMAWSCPEHTKNTSLRDTNIACSFFFLFELLIRFASCPAKCRFFKSFFNIIDFLHVFPMFIYCCVILARNEESSAPWVFVLCTTLLAISLFFRAIRILKIASLSWKMQVLFLALRACAKELLMLLLVDVVLMVAFASVAFFTEQGTEYSQFHSIPAGMWWSIVTLTTVGYGDIIPVTPLGKLVGTLCALSGIAVIALAVSTVVHSFHKIYTSTEARMRMAKEATNKKANYEL